MAIKFNTKKARKFIYFAVVIVLSFWAIFVINKYWQQNTANTASTNNAILIDIKNGFANLPKPNVILPGQTSGNADPVISNYLASQKTLTKIRIEQANLFLHGYSTFSLSSLNSKSQNVINDLNGSLYNLTNIISATQKFIEYNPKIDLAPLVNGDEQGDQERVNRTKTGIQDVLNAVKASGYSKSKEIEAILSPLPAQVDQITPTSVKSWYITVDKAQKDIIAIIHNDYESVANDSSTRIDEIGTSYLE